MGLKTAGGTMVNLITRNTPVPTNKEKMFTTFKDNQQRVKVEVYEGERALVKHNHFLGKFQLDNIPPGKRGSHKFRVTFAISDEGLLTVSAFHVGYGSNAFNLTIDGDSGRCVKGKKTRTKKETSRIKTHRGGMLLRTVHMLWFV